METSQKTNVDQVLGKALIRRTIKFWTRLIGLRLCIYGVILAALFVTDKAVTFFVAEDLRPMLDSRVFYIVLDIFRGYATMPGLLIVGLGILLADRRGYWRVTAGVMMLLVTASATSAVKASVDRVRPERLIVQYQTANKIQYRADGQRSFPSGHATAAFSVYGSASVFYPKASPVFLALAVACSISRVLSLRHFPSDVYVGGLIGYYLTIALLALPIFRWVREEPGEVKSGDDAK